MMKDREKWMELCEQAAKEQDPTKFVGLMNEVERLLAEKENRLKSQRRGESSTTPS